jgi:hypothetical protein
MSKKTAQEYFHSHCIPCNEPANINRMIFDCGKMGCHIQKHVCGMLLTDDEIKTYEKNRWGK